MAKKEYKQIDEAAMLRTLEKNKGKSVEQILRLAWTMGLSATEIHDLKWSEVSFEDGQIHLPDRSIPMDEEMRECLQNRYDRVGKRAEFVVTTDLRQAHMHRVHISKFSSEALHEEETLQEITLKDLRSDFIIRMLGKHDWRFVARISGLAIPTLYANYSQYMSKEGRAEKQAEAEIDEIALWNVMQQEGSSPVGLTLWLVWQMGISAMDVLALTWEQVDLDAQIIHLKDRDVATGRTIDRLLRQVKERRAPDADSHVLLSPKAQKPYDDSRLSVLVKTALVRAGIEGVTLDVLRDLTKKQDVDNLVLNQAKKTGYITRNEVMDLLTISKAKAYTQLLRLTEQKKLVKIGAKYYVAGMVVKPEDQYEKICSYLEELGSGCRQDIADLLHIEARQCSRILHDLVAKGKLEKQGQRYLLPQTDGNIKKSEEEHMKFIHYQVIQETNVGTMENPVIKKELRKLTIGPIAERSFDEIYKKVAAEAYNGEVTVEEITG